MANGELITKGKLSEGALLFAASFFLYSAASPGNLTGDTEVRWSVSRQIVRVNGIFLEDDLPTNNYVIGAGGKRYSYYGAGQSVCMLPFAAMGLGIEKVWGISPKSADLAAQFLTSIILFPAIGATLVWLFYRLVLLLGYTKRAGIFSSSVLAFSTMNFHYSVNTQEQTQIALLLVLAILLITKYHKEQRFVYGWLFCVVLGMCLLFRTTSAVVIFPLYLIAVLSEVFGPDKKNRSHIIGKWLMAGVLGTGGFIVTCVWYNFARFGSIFESGYGLVDTVLGGHTMFESAPLPTAAAMLFSPGKSIFLYNPVLLLLSVCLWPFCRRHKFLAIVIITVTTGNFLLYSFCTTWAGDYAWSIRYQVVVLPFLVLPLVELFIRPFKALVKTVIISVIAVSCVIQLASVVYNFNLEFVQNPNHHLIPDDYVWDWSQSHLRKRFENIFRHIADKRDFSSVKVTDEEPLLLKYNHSEESVRNAYHVNFFPFKAQSKPSIVKLFYPLFILWLVLLAGFFVSIFKLTQFYIRQNRNISTERS